MGRGSNTINATSSDLFYGHRPAGARPSNPHHLQMQTLMEQGLFARAFASATPGDAHNNSADALLNQIAAALVAPAADHYDRVEIEWLFGTTGIRPLLARSLFVCRNIVHIIDDADRKLGSSTANNWPNGKVGLHAVCGAKMNDELDRVRIGYFADAANGPKSYRGQTDRWQSCPDCAEQEAEYPEATTTFAQTAITDDDLRPATKQAEVVLRAWMNEAILNQHRRPELPDERELAALWQTALASDVIARMKARGEQGIIDCVGAVDYGRIQQSLREEQHPSAEHPYELITDDTHREAIAAYVAGVPTVGGGARKIAPVYSAVMRGW